MQTHPPGYTTGFDQYQASTKLWESMHPGMKLLMGQDSRVSFMFSVDDSVTLIHDYSFVGLHATNSFSNPYKVHWNLSNLHGYPKNMFLCGFISGREDITCL